MQRIVPRNVPSNVEKVEPLARLMIASAFVTAVFTMASPTALAQAAAGDGDELPRIRITNPNQDLLRLAVANAVGDAAGAREASEVARRDFEIVGLFKVLDSASFPPALNAEGLGFSAAAWTQVGAQGIVKMSVSRGAGGAQVEGRLYQIGRGETPVLSHTYQGADTRAAVHAFVNDVIGTFTGTKGVFGSRIFLAQNHGKEIMSVGMDGFGTNTLTQMKSDSLLPAVSTSGTEVAFTSFLRGNPDLYVVSAGGGRARRVSQRPGMNTGACWMPDGKSLLATLSFEGSADVYRISVDDGKILKRLTNDSSIESSPSISPDGTQVAFVSNRQGTPQLFIMPVGGGGAKRVTFQGSYNQTPKWNPRGDKPAIAFTGRDERGVFDVFVLDVRSGKIDRMTQNQGSNYDPTWAPDGRLLAYASTRGGLYILNPETRQETLVWKGAARSPSWGPVPASRK